MELYSKNRKALYYSASCCNQSVLSTIKIIVVFASLFIILLGCDINWPIEQMLLHADYDNGYANSTEHDLMPQVACDGQGNWIVVWYGKSRTKGATSGNCKGGGASNYYGVYSARSITNGKQWTAAHCIGTLYTNDRSPSIASDKKGNWLVTWTSDNDEQNFGKDDDIFFTMSTNTSWSQPHPNPWGGELPLNTNVKNDAGRDINPQATFDGQTKWVVVWQSNEVLGSMNLKNDDDIFVSVSTNGNTWSDPQPLNTNAGQDNGDDRKPQIASDGQGNLIAVWESNDALGNLNLGTDYDILVSRSTNGTIWSPPVAINDYASKDMPNDNDLSPQIAYGNGRWIVVWQSSYDLNNTIASDADILYSYCTINDPTWSSPKSVAPNAKSDKGNDVYPRIAYGNGRWVVVWQSNEDVGGASGNLVTDFDILMTNSRDNGDTWDFNSAVHKSARKDGSTFSDPDENPSLATDGNGNWIIFWSSQYRGDNNNWGQDYDILYVTLTMK